jgi:glycerophosphoryl diester phosphodiesterase
MSDDESAGLNGTAYGKDGAGGGPGAGLVLPRVIGHRGAAGRAPENTLGGIRRAAELGAPWIEVDVMLTADGVPILHHDYNFARTCAHPTNVAELTRVAVDQLDAGSWFGLEWEGERVPGLEEAMELFAELGLGVNLELKPTPGRAEETAEAVLDLVTRGWPDGLPAPLISSFTRACLETARDYAPDLPRGRLYEEVPDDWIADAAQLEVASIHLWRQGLTHARVEAVQAEGYRVAVYTVNEPEEAQRLLEWGVEALITDVPDTILPLAE